MALPPLTAEWLIAAVRGREASAGEIQDCSLRQFIGGIAILRALLGDGWLEKRIGRAATRTFFLPGHEGDLAGYKAQDRVTRLAELLYNFQFIEGFEHRVRELSTASVETALAELEGAGILYRAGVPFRFVIPSGKPGADYDVEAIVGAMTIPCEMKAKLESTEPSASSIVNTFERVRGDQLPPDSPGVVFLWVPPSWTDSAAGRTAILEGVPRALRSTGRIARVIVHWEEWHKIEPQGALRVARFRQWVNPSARVQLSALDQLVEVPPNVGSSNWVDLGQLLCGPEHQLRSQSINTALRSEDWLRGRGPQPDELGGLIAYSGDLSAIRSADPRELVTNFDFECSEFEFFDLADLEALCIDVTFDEDVETRFTVCRDGNMGSLQFQLPGLIHDSEIQTDGSVINPPVERISRISAGLNAGEDIENIDNGDPVLQKIRELFAKLRLEGALVRPYHLLRNMSVWYAKKGAAARMFTVEYRNWPFRV